MCGLALPGQQGYFNGAQRVGVPLVLCQLLACCLFIAGCEDDPGGTAPPDTGLNPTDAGLESGVEADTGVVADTEVVTDTGVAAATDSGIAVDTSLANDAGTDPDIGVADTSGELDSGGDVEPDQGTDASVDMRPPDPIEYQPCETASCWDTGVEPVFCGAALVQQDFSSGLYNVHSYRSTLYRVVPNRISLVRTAPWQPAILVAELDGTILYDGVTGLSRPGLEVLNILDGRTGDEARVEIATNTDLEVTIFVTGWEVVDNNFGESLPIDARYRLRVSSDCYWAFVVSSDAIGVFVSETTGRVGGAGTMDDPLQELDDGITLAEADSKIVFVAGGEYTGGVTTSVSILGGFDPSSWTYDLPAQQTVIRGVGDDQEGIRVEPGMDRGAVIDGVQILTGPNGDSTARGLIIINGTVVVSRCVIESSLGLVAETDANIYATNNVIRTSGTQARGVAIGGTAVLINNTIFATGVENASGVHVANGHVTLINNIVQTVRTGGLGGGLNFVHGVDLWRSSIMARNNSIYGDALTCHLRARRVADEICLDPAGINDCNFTGCTAGTSGNLDYSCDVAEDGTLSPLSFCENEGVNPESYYDVAPISGLPMGGFLNYDIHLQARPQNTSWDLGADEL